MTFEEKLSKIYNEIANEISNMIPVEWEKVYTMAYIDDGGGEVFFNYTKPGSDDLIITPIYLRRSITFLCKYLMIYGWIYMIC